MNDGGSREDLMEYDFIQKIKSNLGCAIVMAGSGSDEKHISDVVKSLQIYNVPHEIRICSAHKQPNKLIDLINYYNQVEGLLAYVAIAGGTDALSGTLAYHALNPVISCPPDAPNQTCTRNPPGSSNVYIEKASNVGRFIAQMYAGVNKDYRELLEKEKSKKIRSLEEDDFKWRKK